MKIKYFFWGLSMSISLSHFGQTTYKITNYPSNEAMTSFNALAIDDKTVWAATNSGVYKLGYNGDVLDFFNTENSNIADNAVTSIVIDKDKNIWFSTRRNGISKFDGYSWTNYNTSNSFIISDQVSALAVDGLNRIWIGTDLGLSCFDNQTWKNYSKFNTSASLEKVLSVAIDNNNNPWLGTQDGGVIWFDGLKWNQQIWVTRSISSVFIDKYNTVWAGSLAGSLYKYKESEWVQVLGANGDMLGIKSLMVDNSDSLWMATTNNGICRMNLDGIKVDIVFPYLKNVNHCALDALNGKWFANSQGVLKYMDKVLSTFINSTPLPTKPYQMLVDTKNSIWVLNDADNYSIYKNNQWYQFPKISGPGGGKLLKIGMDINGTVWVTSSGNGVFKNTTKDPDWINFSTSNSDLPGDIVYDLCLDTYGKLWFATNNGIASFDGTNWEVYMKDWAVNREVFSIKTDFEGKLWAGKTYGLYSFDGKDWQLENNIDYVKSIESFPGSVYFWSSNQGLYVYKDGSFTQVLKIIEFSGLALNQIACDLNNNLWFASDIENFGIIKFDGINSVNYSTTNTNLLADNVKDIFIDHLNNKWILTNNGISRLSCTNAFPNFETGEKCTGDVHFINNSGNIDPFSKFAWDFNYDGTIETETRDAVHNFQTAGDVYVSLVVQNDNCINNILKNITINQVPAKPLLETTKDALCFGDTIFCSNYQNGQSFQWKVNSTNAVSDSGNYFVVKSSMDAEYLLHITDQNGCSIESDTLNIEMYNSTVPEIEIKFSDVLVCNNFGNLYSDFQWFADDVKIDGANQQYYQAESSQVSYAVQAIDNNGCLVRSDNIRLKNFSVSKLFPNPATTCINLQFESEKNGQVVLSIFNSTGLELNQIQLEKNDQLFHAEIPLQGLKKGSYIMQYRFDGKLESKFFSVE